MLDTEIHELKTDGVSIKATCPKCQHTWTFYLGRTSKTSSKACPKCHATQRFKRPEELKGLVDDKAVDKAFPSASEVDAHKAIDKDLSGALDGIFAMLQGSEDKGQGDAIKKEVESLVPQGFMFTMALEMYLEGKLPPGRANYYAVALGPNLDLLCRKYGLSNVLGAYGLEITTALTLWGLFSEIQAYERPDEEKEGGKKIDISEPSITDEAEQQI